MIAVLLASETKVPRSRKSIELILPRIKEMGKVVGVKPFIRNRFHCDTVMEASGVPFPLQPLGSMT